MPQLAQLHKGQFSMIYWTDGLLKEVIGVIVWDRSTDKAALRLRRDFHLLADDEDDLEILSILEDDLSQKLAEMGPAQFFDWIESSFSNAITISDREEILVESADRALAHLYRQHVPAQIQQYETHLPRVSLAAAAGSWGEAMSPETKADFAEEWIELLDDLRIDDQMFIAEVTGRSMEPEIPDGSLCVFRYAPAGSRDGRKVLVENFSDASQRYTVKRYRSMKAYDPEGQVSGRRVRLEPLNPEFSPWELTEGEDVRVLAEFLRILN